MFAVGLDNVVAQVTEGLEKLQNKEAFYKGFSGANNDEAVNRLHSRFHGRVIPVSQYVTRQAVLQVGDAAAQTFRNTAELLKNASLMGWVFEAEVALRIEQKQKAKLRLEFKEGTLHRRDNGPSAWDAPEYDFMFDSPRVEYDGKSPIQHLPIPSWIVPTKFNQGCFDFVYVPSADTLVLLQLTVASTHDIKWEFVHRLLQAISADVRRGIKTVDLRIIVPHDSKMSLSHISHVGSFYLRKSSRNTKETDGQVVPVSNITDGMNLRLSIWKLSSTASS
jgi:hypothetical protein